MKIMVFDTETTGLPQTKFINTDTLHLWPHIVQFSYTIYDTEKNELVDSTDFIIKVSDSVTISSESMKIHKITNEISADKGVEIEKVIREFIDLLTTVDLLVGHNISFDLNMVKVEMMRIIQFNERKVTPRQLRNYKSDLDYLYKYKNIYCTLRESIHLCNIFTVNKYGKKYLKFPKLLELHEKLFDSTPMNLHNSFNDILVTLRCFIKLYYDIDLDTHCPQFSKLIELNQILN
jgi:DNA polymerase III epsilon subunit-like protein